MKRQCVPSASAPCANLGYQTRGTEMVRPSSRSTIRTSAVTATRCARWFVPISRIEEESIRPLLKNSRHVPSVTPRRVFSDLANVRRGVSHGPLCASRSRARFSDWGGDTGSGIRVRESVMGPDAVWPRRVGNQRDQTRSASAGGTLKTSAGRTFAVMPRSTSHTSPRAARSAAGFAPVEFEKDPVGERHQVSVDRPIVV